MIRLTVIDADCPWPHIGSRIRRATADVCAHARQLRAEPQPYDAAVFVGRTSLDVSSAARQHGVQLAVANPDRYLPSRQLIRQQLDAGRLGEVGLVRVHRWRSGHSAGPQAAPAALVRDLDLALWLIGRPPDVVFAVEHSAKTADGVSGQFVQVHLGLPGGATALIDYCDRLPAGDGYDSLSVIGSAGAAYADDHQNMQLIYRGGRPQAVRTDEGPQQLAALVQQFVDAIAAGRDLSPSVAAWQDVLGVVACVRQSIESRQAIAREGC